MVHTTLGVLRHGINYLNILIKIPLLIFEHHLPLISILSFPELFSKEIREEEKCSGVTVKKLFSKFLEIKTQFTD